MEEEAEEIESLDPPEKKEEPWCPVCRAFTDYRRKWNTVTRANLDGGVYSENSELPHCIECNQPMLFLSQCKNLCRFFSFLGILLSSIAFSVFFLLLPLSLANLLGFSTFVLLGVLVSRIPHKSRKCLADWKLWKKEQGIKELTDMGLKN
jgi:hypothetical protein